MLTNNKKLSVIAAALVGLVAVAQANTGGAALQHANNDVANTASLQRGARNFMNYCSGCHSAKYVRFNRLAADLGLSDDEVRANLMFVGERPADQIRNAMDTEDARRWFGNPPPDLSLIARSKSPDYIFTFLKSFYLDPARPSGVGNSVPEGGTAMPHVLWELQGLQRKVEEGKADAHGDIEKHFTGFELVTKGTKSPEEYDEFVRDTVNFLDYIGEPMQMQRRSLGSSVIIFLLIFFGVAYFLKKEYWKDVK